MMFSRSYFLLAIMMALLGIGRAMMPSEGMANGFTIEVTHVPHHCNKKATPGSMVSVHYTGTLENGKEFDSSRGRGKPIDFKLGAGQVIKGWDHGIEDMCIGEKRKLTIPPEMGYGDRSVGPIPGGSTLYFDVELMDVQK